jgi:predicted MFS family arabinose efflux permease
MPEDGDPVTLANYPRRGIAALLIANCAGMLDLVALPVWMGALIGALKLDPQQAGLLVTLFFAGQVTSSLLLAPRFQRLPVRMIPPLGFAGAAIGFFALGRTGSYPAMALLHAACGLAAGTALSMTHGTMGRGANPHRLFALGQLAVGVFGIIVMGSGPKVVAAFGGSALFTQFSLFMLIAAVVTAVAFPRPLPERRDPGIEQGGRLPRAVWFGMFGIGCLCVGQAMIFSFVERIGMDRGYGVDMVASVLVAAGLFNLLPGPAAALLEKRLRAERVVLVAPLVHLSLVLGLTQTALVPAYVVGVMGVIATAVFAHTFLFGLLSRLDPTGRAVSATPAMLMIGSAIGPVLGGSIVKAMGYGALGIGVAVMGVLSLLCFTQVQPRAVAAPALPRQA